MNESKYPNGFKIGRESDGSQGRTRTESIIFDPCDTIRHCNPLQGSTTKESIALDGGNRRSNDDFRDIFRDEIITATKVSVDFKVVIGAASDSNVYNAHGG